MMAHKGSTQSTEERGLIASIALVTILIITLAIVASIFIRSL